MMAALSIAAPAPASAGSSLCLPHRRPRASAMTSNKKGSTSTAQDVARPFNERLVELLEKAPDSPRRRRSSGAGPRNREAKAGKYIRELHQKAKAKTFKPDK